MQTIGLELPIVSGRVTLVVDCLDDKFSAVGDPDDEAGHSPTLLRALARQRQGLRVLSSFRLFTALRTAGGNFYPGRR
jgi:hypothetical protein